MKLFFSLILLLLSFDDVLASAAPAPETKPSSYWLRPVFHRLHQVWMDGQDELYAPVYAWHNRFTYTAEKIHSYNENPWGGGLGKSFYDEQGDWHGLYAFAFLDSHKNVEPVVGYAFLKVLHTNENTRAGAGYGILVTARPDIFHNIPFPGVLPWVSFGYRKASLAATYIPGAKGAGNVLFLILKYLI
jgi:palmitoyl transferase